MKASALIKSGVAALGLALASAAISAAPALPATKVTASAAEARPALWQVSDADTTVYLFGTIHVLPGSVGWRTPAIDRIMARSDGLVLETVIEDTPTALAASFNRLGVREGLPPFLQRFEAKNRPAITAAIVKSGIPQSRYDQMETWAATLTLVGLQAGSSGYKGSDGVETILKKNFVRAGKPVGQLETNVDQLSMYDGLSEHAQRAMLTGMIGDPGARARSVRGQLDAMVGTWVSGDVAGIARSFNAELARQPELRQALLTRRNARWATWIDQRMDKPGSVMVAVGAGHLAGEGSVLQELESHGYTVSRIQ
jgi:uncharacterized protein YbaP (TraB family)